MKSLFIVNSALVILLLVLSACSSLSYDPDLQGVNERQSNMEMVRVDAVETLIEGYMEEEKLLGLQISFTYNNYYYSAAFGYEDESKTQSMTRASILRTGSIAKTVTALNIMKLVDNNALSLDDSIEQWAPEIANSQNITIRHLLEHTSGINNSTFSFPFMSKVLTSPNRVWQYSEMFEVFNQRSPDFSPSSDFHYSNPNYVLLSYIAEQVSDKSMTQLVEEFAQRYNMSSTAYVGEMNTQVEIIDGYDRSYLPTIGPYTHEGNSMFWSSLEKGAGGMVSTADDLMQLGLSFTHSPFISPQSFRYMTTPGPYPAEGIPGAYYGLGLIQYQVGEDTYWGHAGVDIGFSSQFCFALDKASVFSVMTNVSELDLLPLIKQIKLLLGR
jgi:D-alanyl-D-alanine carboxypeptidase